MSHYDEGTFNENPRRSVITPDSDIIVKDRMEEAKQTNYRIVKEVKRYDSKIRTANGERERAVIPKTNYSHKHPPHPRG